MDILHLYHFMSIIQHLRSKRSDLRSIWRFMRSVLSKRSDVTVRVGGYGLTWSMSLWMAGERHGNEVTPVEIQRPAGLPCLSVSANNGQEKKGRGSQFVLPSPTPPFSLCLDFIWLTGGCMQTGAGSLWSPSRTVQLCVCAHGCVRV